MTQSHPSLQDKRVRRAIQLAIDVPSILLATDGGHTAQATGIAAPGVPGYRAGKELKRDVETAKQLIKEAGVEGLSVKLEFVNTTERNTAALIMQQNLAEIGIHLEVNGQDEGTFWSIDEAKTADMQLHLKAWTGNPDTHYTLQYFVADQIGIWNWEAFEDDEYNQLLNQARATTDDAERGKIYERMQEILEESGSFLFISQSAYPTIYRNTIKPGMLPDGRPVFHAFKKSS